MGFILPQHQTGNVPGFAGAVDVGLLATIVDFVTSASGTPGLDWTVEMNVNATDNNGDETAKGSNTKEVILSNTGISGNEDIYIGLREYYNAATNEYGLELNGYLSVPAGWNSHAAATHKLEGYDATRDHWTQLPVLQCFDQEMEYWFYSTQEFIFIALRVGTSYFQAYLGNGQRLGSPSEYPYPLVIAGSTVGNVSYQAGGFGPVRPGLDAADEVGEYTCFFVDAQGSFNTMPIVEPMQGVSTTFSMDVTADGEAFMCPVFYRDSDQTFLQLYNVFCIRVINMLSEVTYTDDDSRVYRAFAQGQTDFDYEFLAVLENDPSLVVTTTTTTSSTTTT